MTGNEPYHHDTYLIRRKIFKILGAAFHIYGPDGELVGYCKQKAFKLREDIRIYTDESCGTELLAILARNVVDFSAAYDVVDALAGEPVGTLRRRGFASLFQDAWIFEDAAGEVGEIREDNLLLSLIRRHLSNLIPQTFHATCNGAPVAVYKQNFNLFVPKLRVTIDPAADGAVDRRLLLAAGILLSAIEGRQQR